MGSRDAVLLVCSECGTISDEQAEDWRAYLTSDAPTEAAIFCPACAEHEFGDNR